MSDLAQRIVQFCDWLESIPPEPPFHTRPEFRFYADLSDADVAAAGAEMRRRSAAHHAEADALMAEKARRAARDA